MRDRVKITGRSPSVKSTAKKLGVSKTVARELSQLAKVSLKTGKFVLSGVGELVLTKRKGRTKMAPMTWKLVKISAKGGAPKVRIVKSSKAHVRLKEK